MTGSTISHYRIVEELGQGGMGVVFKAEDTKLGRTVALKLLAPHLLASDSDRARFNSEARAAAKLHHPNIATVFEIDETDDGRPFIAMEFINGQSLESVIADGPVPIENAVAIGIQIAEALNAAHAKDIVHRDIKSANIMLDEEGRAKVLDFGLAKVQSSTRLTTMGSTLGTVSYMSPEQSRGEDVDHRSDLWSLGVVLYEMISGKLPFAGDYEQAVVYGILNGEPRPLTAVRTGVPMELERIVGKCLDKDKSLRYQHCGDLIADLRRITLDDTSAQPGHQSPSDHKRTATRPKLGRIVAALAVLAVLAAAIIVGLGKRSSPVRDNPRLVVLPFENRGAAVDEYLGVGIAEDIATKLMEVRELTVLAMSSAIEYARTGTDYKDIGSESGANYVLDGSVRWAGDEESARVRVTSRLIRVADNAQLWGEAYDEDPSDVLSLQTDVANDVVRSLNVVLAGNERQRIQVQRTESIAAYQAYLKGRFHWNKRTASALVTAFEYFEEATRLDSTYALAYSGLADAHFFLHLYGSVDAASLEKSRQAAERSFQLDPNLAEAHASMANVRYSIEHDWDAGERHLQSSISVNPNFSRGHHWYAILLAEQGRQQEAMREIAIARDLDPLSLIINTNEGWPVLAFLGRFDEAITRLEETRNLDSDYWLVNHWLAVMYAVTGQVTKSVEAARNSVRLSDNSTQAVAVQAYVTARAGRIDEAEAMLEALAQRAATEYVSPYEIAAVYAGLERPEEAMRWLETAFDQSDVWVKFIGRDPRLDPIRVARGLPNWLSARDSTPRSLCLRAVALPTDLTLPCPDFSRFSPSQVSLRPAQPPPRRPT